MFYVVVLKQKTCTQKEHLLHFETLDSQTIPAVTDIDSWGPGSSKTDAPPSTASSSTLRDSITPPSSSLSSSVSSMPSLSTSTMTEATILSSANSSLSWIELTDCPLSMLVWASWFSSDTLVLFSSTLVVVAGRIVFFGVIRGVCWFVANWLICGCSLDESIASHSCGSSKFAGFPGLPSVSFSGNRSINFTSNNKTIVSVSEQKNWKIHYE